MCDTCFFQCMRQKGFGNEWSVCREGYRSGELPLFIAEEAGRSVMNRTRDSGREKSHGVPEI